MAVTASTVLMVGLTAASSAYQYSRQRSLARKAKREADARKGFEIVTEGEIISLPIAYGRNKIGGARVYHNVSSTYDDRFKPAMRFDSGMPAALNHYKREFLYFQQALAYGGVSRVVDVVIDEDRSLDDEDIKESPAGYRIDILNTGDALGELSSLMKYNCPNRQEALFTDVSYASCVFKLNWNDPQFTSVPNLGFIVEGRKVRTLAGGNLGAAEYSTNPSFILVDYLLNFARIPLEFLDLNSFQDAAAVCDTIVLSNAAVGGRIFKPAHGSPGVETRDIPLYECNILLDTAKPHRENVEDILDTMGDARLVWSQGVYRLVLQYPGVDNADLDIAGVITDDELILGEQMSIKYPQADTRLNNCKVKYSDEAYDFKEATIAWPISTPFTNELVVPKGSLFYPPASGFYKGGAGTFLNNHAVAYGREVPATFVWIVKPAFTATYTFDFLVEFNGAVEIGLASNYTIPTDRSQTAANPGAAIYSHVSSRAVYTGWGDGQDVYYRVSPNSTSFTLSADVSYLIRMEVTEVAYFAGSPWVAAVAGRLTRADGSLFWTTREPSIVGYDVQDFSGEAAIYDQLLAEDNNIRLESEISLSGVTSVYHAKAKAEEMVRTSRTAATFEFDHLILDRYFEPGDVVQLYSESLDLGVSQDLFIKVDSVKGSQNGMATLTGTRFDGTQLAWNVADDQYVKPQPVSERPIQPPSMFEYVPHDFIAKDSVGKLAWLENGDPRVVEYELFMHVVGDMNPEGGSIFRTLGRSVESPFGLPNLITQDVIFGIQSLGRNTSRSEMLLTTPSAINPAVPPAVTNLAVTAVGELSQSIELTWTIPALREDGTDYNNHLIARIYRNTVNDFATARSVAFTQEPDSYIDTPLEYVVQYYWIVLSSTTGQAGPESNVASIEHIYVEMEPDPPFIPPAPTNLTGLSQINGIYLFWDVPVYAEGDGHHSTILYGKLRTTGDTLPTLEECVVLASPTGASYFHNTNSDETWTYYIREKTIEGGVSTTAGGPLTVTSEVTSEALIAELSGKISESELAAALNTRIDLVDVGPDALTSRVSTNESTIQGVSAQYTVKVDVNGAVAGYGLASTPSDDTANGQFSEFYINADRFAVLPQGGSLGDAISPFIVDGGVAYINVAHIRDLSVDEGKLGPITFNKVVDSNGASVTTVSGLLKVENIDVDNLVVNQALSIVGQGVLATQDTAGADDVSFNYAGSNTKGGKVSREIDATLMPPGVTPAGNGLHMTKEYLGFYNGGWKTYIKSDGQFRFEGNASNYLSWNGGTLTLALDAIGAGAAVGSNSIAFGNGAWASSSNSVAIGKSSNAGGSAETVALGYQATCGNAQSIAIGSKAETAYQASIAVGYASDALSMNALAVGVVAKANGDGAIAIGYNARVFVSSQNVGGLAMGINALSYEKGVAIGRDSQAAIDAVAIGSYTTTQSSGGVLANRATALGYSASADAFDSTAVGANTSVTGDGSSAFGKNASESVQDTIKLGTGLSTVIVDGSFHAASKNFRITHPLDSDDWLIHSCYEGPVGGGTIYRYTITAIDNTATLQLPDYFDALNADVVVMCQADRHFGRAYAKVSGNILTLTSDADGDYHLVIMGTRKDEVAVAAWKGDVVRKTDGEVSDRYYSEEMNKGRDREEVLRERNEKTRAQKLRKGEPRDNKKGKPE